MDMSEDERMKKLSDMYQMLNEVLGWIVDFREAFEEFYQKEKEIRNERTRKR